MTLRNELIKIIVDKLFLAAVLAVFGFFLNRLLERFRSRLSFSTELNKIRVSKIAELWEKLYEFEQSAEMSKHANSNNQSRFEELFQKLHELMQHNVQGFIHNAPRELIGKSTGGIVDKTC
ncbi:MAG TPA: hypothetical protein VN687_13700 [Blastocatellia bacterium]|nr:hypothetical protein [Blastocatellia bacterium]